MTASSTRRILIWGKTYPELSERHRETVCTGGCLEDGTPIRIYPVPLRYLPAHNRYSLYDWIEVPITPSTKDRRPESHKIKSEALRQVGHIGTENGWLERRQFIFSNPSWHYQCVEDLRARERLDKTSMGMVTVGAVDKVVREWRTDEERRVHEEKLARLKSKIDLFDERRAFHLEFCPFKIRVHWRCTRLDGPNRCRGHTAAVLDWGLGELGRRRGADAALSKMEELANVDKYDLRFYMGNFKAHPRNFGIVGLWYPQRAAVARNPVIQESLF